MDALALQDHAALAGPAEQQGLARLQVQLDALLGLVPQRQVLPVAEIEVGVEQAVEPAPRVQVESGGDAERVVAGGF